MYDDEDGSPDVTEYGLMFIDQVLLPALSDICPFERQNFGLSPAADSQRFKDRKGRIFPKSASIHGSKFDVLLWRMRDIIEDVGGDLDDFKGFFFDTWAAGIKEEYQSTIEDTITDIKWDTVVQATSFIDIACEIFPHNSLVGIPYKACLGSIMEHLFGSPGLRSCETRYHIHHCKYFVTQFTVISYRFDRFIHFDHLSGCATHTTNGLPSGYFGTSMAQIYGKYKVPFYNHLPHQDRNGKSIEPAQIMKGELKGFKVKLSCVSDDKVLADILLKGLLDPTLEEFQCSRFGVRLEARVALDRALYAWDEWPTDLQ